MNQPPQWPQNQPPAWQQQPGNFQQPYGQQPYGYQPAGPPPPRRRKKHTVRNISAAAGAVIVAVIAISAASRNGSPQAPPAAPAAATSAASAPATAASRPRPAVKPGPRTVATFTGSGIANTPRFTVTSTWKLAYSFSCENFGQPGNFAVSEDGGNDLSGLAVNDLAMKKSASTWAYDDAGTHYLAVNSECSWTVKVTDEP
jgi:hypothetical protein